MYKKGLNYLFILFVPLFIFSQEKNSANTKIIDLTNNFKNVNVSEKIEVIKNNGYSVSEVLNIFKNKKDSLLIFNKVANFSGHNRGWWVNMYIENTSNKELDVTIQIRNSYIHSAKFYKVLDSITLFGITGTMVPINARTSHERFMNGKLMLPPKKAIQILVEVDKTAIVKLPVRIFESHWFGRLNTIEHLLYGVYFGFILVLFLYAISLAISMRNRMLLEYAIYLLSFGLMVFCISGFVHRFLITNGSSYLEFIYQDAVSLVLLSMTFFTISFLELRKHMPKYVTYLKCLMGVYVFWYLGLKFLWVLNMINGDVSIFLFGQYMFIILFFISAFLAGILNRRFKKKESNLYLMAYGSFFLATIFSLSFEFITNAREDINADFSIVYESAYMTGSVLEIVFFTLGISIFIRNINYQRLNLQNELREEKFENSIKIEELKNIVIKDYIVLKDKTKIYITDLMYVKSEDHYLSLYLSNGKNHFVRGKLKNIKEELPPNFVQCHRSYIVNRNFVKQINSESLTLLLQERIPLSRTYRNRM